ncbi:MAG: hypothetical protein SGJ09_10155 [Phycisphaerae bacterium]|nr:hypothetical protein [Phycisphaerae bacterium]
MRSVAAALRKGSAIPAKNVQMARNFSSALRQVEQFGRANPTA